MKRGDDGREQEGEKKLLKINCLKLLNLKERKQIQEKFVFIREWKTGRTNLI
jgi:hypothetical protein